MIVTVFNLKNDSAQIFSCPPEEAVVAAYEQAQGNWNIQSYPLPQDHPEFTKGKYTVWCGAFGAVVCESVF